MRQIDFENGKITRNIALAVLPMLVAQIINLLYSIVDRIYIGQIPGEGQMALGGIGLCFPVIIMITAFTNLFGSGGSPLCAIALGQKNTVRAEDIMNVAFFLLTITSVILMAAGEIFARPLLFLFGASEESIVYALPYLRIYLAGTFFSMTASGLNPYINAQGFSTTGMLTAAAGAVINIILDPVLIFGFHMGVQGAAIATVISQMISALAVLGFLSGSRPLLKLHLIPFSKFSEERKTVSSIVSLGTASFIMQFTNSLVSVCCNQVLSHFGGDLYVSIMTIVSSIRQIIDTPVIAFGDGASPVISYNYGAKKPENIRKTIRILTVMNVLYTFAVWLLIQIFPQTFIRIFSNDKTLMKDAIPAVRTYFSMFVFQALQISGQTVFKSMNKKKKAIFFSLFRKVVMVVPLTYLLPYVFRMGTSGVFLAEPISNLVGGCACFLTMLLTIRPELKEL